MKTLSAYQVEFVRNFIREQCVTSTILVDELTDHICTDIEKKGFSNEEEFNTAFEQVLKDFKEESFVQIQNITNGVINNLNNKEMKSIKFILVCLTGYASFAMIVSLFLELSNNPSADALRMTGYIVYSSTIALLAYFLMRFKKFVFPFKIIIGLLGYLLAFILIVLGLREVNFDAGNNLLQTVPFLSFGILGISLFFYVWLRVKGQTIIHE